MLLLEEKPHNFQQIIRRIYNRPPQKVNDHCFKVKTLNNLNLCQSKKVKYISNAKRSTFPLSMTQSLQSAQLLHQAYLETRVHCSTWRHNLIRANFWKRQWWHTNHLDPQMSGQHNPDPNLQLPLQYCRAHWHPVEVAFLQS